MARRLSWLFVVLTAALPLFALVETVRGYATYSWMIFVGLLPLYIVTLYATLLLSALALAFGCIAYRGLHSPRPRTRVVELVIIGLPLFAVLCTFLLLISLLYP